MDLTIRIETPAELTVVRPLNLFFRRLIEQVPSLSSSEKLLDDLELAFNEAFMNVHDHAYRSDEKGLVAIEIRIGTDQLEVRFEDYGASFDPDQLPDTEPDTRSERGRGIWLIRHIVDEFVYTSGEDGKNTLTLVKKFPLPGGKPG